MNNPQPTPTTPKPFAWRRLIMLVLFAWNILFLAHPVFLTPADIGRHIKNGQILASTPLSEWRPLLTTNFYSYTFPNFPFINHHWLSGLVLYNVFNAAGFLGVSLFGLALCSLTLWLAVDLARRASSFGAAATLTFFLIPLIAWRFEVRPELFSYFFAVLFWWLLYRWRQENLNSRWLWVLPLLIMIWVNLHIYFFLGFLIMGSFWLETLFNYKKNPRAFWLLTALGLASIIAGLFNPNTLNGLTYPLHIYDNYGAAVGENESVPMAAQRFPWAVDQVTFKISLATLLLLGPLSYKQKKLPPASLIIWLVFLSVFAWGSVRNLSLFAFFVLTGMAFLIHNLFGQKLTLASRRVKSILVASVVLLTLLINLKHFSFIFQTRGIGIMPHMNDAAAFIKNNNITGPLFNDFDSGSFIIYNLYPTLRPFVDNRPEAYPAQFFNDVYVPLHTDQAVWEETDKKYNFNVIYYSFDDNAPFALPFILARIPDPAWAPVYTDKFAIILLKRNAQNAELIKKYEIPQSNFSVEPKS